jgi:hypothetical protein
MAVETIDQADASRTGNGICFDLLFVDLTTCSRPSPLTVPKQWSCVPATSTDPPDDLARRGYDAVGPMALDEAGAVAAMDGGDCSTGVMQR